MSAHESYRSVAPCRTLLVDLPFASLYRPNLALETLRGCLEKYSYQCDVWYSKYHFARMLGRECYDTFSDRLSYTILPGDLAFAQALGSIDLHLSKTKVYKEINEETLRELPQIQECAVKFIENLVELIVKDGCDLVGLNLTFQIAPALALARGIYKRSKRPWIIIGGGNCEAGMGEALIRQLPWIDFVCRGEGEELIVNLLKILSMHDTEPGSRTWTKNQRPNPVLEHGLKINGNNYPISKALYGVTQTELLKMMPVHADQRTWMTFQYPFMAHGWKKSKVRISESARSNYQLHLRQAGAAGMVSMHIVHSAVLTGRVLSFGPNHQSV
jgi:hypothetical protein